MDLKLCHITLKTGGHSSLVYRWDSFSLKVSQPLTIVKVVKNLAAVKGFQIFNNQKNNSKLYVKNPRCFWQLSSRLPKWLHHSFGSEHARAFCTVYSITSHNAIQHSLETYMSGRGLAFTMLKKSFLLL